jgi:hypothetical protein
MGKDAGIASKAIAHYPVSKRLAGDKYEKMKYTYLQM